MTDKRRKTAVGVLSQAQTCEYMRDTPIGEPHLSYGGAGWIHPKEIKAGLTYGQGDSVKVEVDFDKSCVRFYVNEHFSGEDEWTEAVAYPAVSVDGGPCTVDVSFDK